MMKTKEIAGKSSLNQLCHIGLGKQTTMGGLPTLNEDEDEEINKSIHTNEIEHHAMVLRGTAQRETFEGMAGRGQKNRKKM